MRSLSSYIVSFALVFFVGGFVQSAAAQSSDDLEAQIFALIAQIAALETQLESTPECFDWDGDGWGWDGEKGCLVADALAEKESIQDSRDTLIELLDQILAQLNEEEVSGDEDDDMVEELECPAESDHDGDGWGWDGEKGCLVADFVNDEEEETSTSTEEIVEEEEAEEETETTECFDWDGDGWGWDGEKGCLVADFEDDDMDDEMIDDDMEEETSTSTTDFNDDLQAQISALQAQLEATTVQRDLLPDCFDWDGDGWGWDGEKGCLVADVVELEDLIVALLAQISQLESQLDDDQIENIYAGVCPYTWTRDIFEGVVGGEDVRQLQRFLNADPDTRVALTGAGSAGMETNTFTPALAQAISKFQVKYRSEVLSPAGLVNPTGEFGPSTRAKVNSLCAVMLDDEEEVEELEVNFSSNDPDSMTIQVEADSKSDWFTVFVFDLDTDDSINDIQINTIPITIELSTSTYDEIIDDAELIVDGYVIDDYTLENGSTDTARLRFDVDGDVVIDTDDEIEVELMLRFEALSPVHEGVTVEASVFADTIEAEGVDHLDATQLSGAVFSETHVLRTAGVILFNESTSESIRINNPGDSTDDQGIFEINFEVTAFETDVYVNQDATLGTALKTAGVNFLIEDSSGSEPGASFATASYITATADEEGDRYIVNEGETESFTLVVEFSPTVSGLYHLQMHSFNFNDTNADPDTQQLALPDFDFKTGSLVVSS